MKANFNTPSFDTLDDLLNGAYSYILDYGQEISGKRGSILEVTNFIATLTNSRARTSSSLDRRLVRSKFAEFAWYLSGDPNRDFITPYIEAYHDEEAENKKILGAYGPKIFGEGENGKSQFERICEQVQLRKNTKQAYLAISDISDYKVRSEKYASPPCTIGLHFLFRNSVLNLTVFMRSNDAYYGLPHDLFCFSMLQEMVAVNLGFHLGSYTHICTSLHIYEDQIGKVKNYISEGLFDPIEMPSMDEINKEILELVVNAFGNNSVELNHTINHLPAYWHDYILFSNKYYLNDNKDEWLALFKTDDLRSIARISVTK